MEFYSKPLVLSVTVVALLILIASASTTDSPLDVLFKSMTACQKDKDFNSLIKNVCKFVGAVVKKIDKQQVLLAQIAIFMTTFLYNFDISVFLFDLLVLFVVIVSKLPVWDQVVISQLVVILYTSDKSAVRIFIVGVLIVFYIIGVDLVLKIVKL